MSLSQLRLLIGKDIDGTITARERDELEAMVREAARHDYEECPACGGAFTADLIFEHEKQCPQCGTRLEHHSSDRPGHDSSEIDPCIEPELRLGEFTSGYTIPGTIPCLKCWVVYPKNYTCCPRLFTTALELHRDGTDSQRQIVVEFFDMHAKTLLNSLCGRFVKCFSRETRDRLMDLASQLKCSAELQGVLAEVQSRQRDR